MANCNTQIDIHRLPGTTQASRFPKALRADFVLLDERNIQDLIISTIKLSKHIQFYGSENVVDGNWTSFFSWEPTSLFAELSTLNIRALQRELKLRVRKLIFIADEANKISEMQLFFQAIQNKLNDYNSKMTKLSEDIQIKEYYLSIYSRVEDLMVYIINQIEISMDTHQLFHDHLFNKQIRNFFGMLTELKSKSAASFQQHSASYPKHSPQYALFLTFLKLFSEAQHEANQFTTRHLDFYYKQVLNLEAEVAQPDYVHGLVVPHKNKDPFILEKDTILIAGKTDDNKTKYYATTSDLVVNQAKIHQVFGGFINKGTSPNSYYFQDFTESISAGESWKPFKNHTTSQNSGFALASPLLFLKGGVRTIEIIFNNWTTSKYHQLKHNFNFFLTTEKDWVEVNEHISIANKIVITLPADTPPIIPLNPEVQEDFGLKTEFPVLKIIAKEGQLIQINISAFTLKVDVKNYKEFSLFSDFGEIDHSKKFDAFGPVPRKGSSIYFSSNEFFQKKNAVGNFIIEMDIPRWNIFEHTSVNLLKNGDWEDEDLNDTIPNSLQIKEKNFTYDDNPVFNKKSVNGIVRIKFQDFDFLVGETITPYLEAFIIASKNVPTTNLPYLPIITDFKFNYMASSGSADVQAFHLYPNGYEQKTITTIVPEIENEGELIVGIQDVQAGQPLSLLIQVEEGTANPTLEPAEVTWQYLNALNDWTDLKDGFGDETNGLTNSGIVFLKVPTDFQFSGQTILPAGVFWLKIAVPTRTTAVCNLIGLHLHAFKAVLTDYEKTGVAYTKHLEPKTISKLLRPKNQIKKIEQPYTSFGGRVKDTDENFYKRTSERLRHRARAISKWDYETLVLDEFPQVHRVKCLPHFQVTNDLINNTSAGHVTIVPVANSTNLLLPLSWRPLVDLNTMKRIKRFLQEHASPHAKIDVIPPNLEHVKFSFKVRYHVALQDDTRLYDEKLNTIINTYLSPWAYEHPENVQFQSDIHTSKIIQIIEIQPFVDYIFDVKSKHYDADKTEVSVTFKSRDKIVPLTDYSLFLPGTHEIINSENVCCT